MASIITIIYTQNTRGQFYLLPRLATLLKQLKQQAEGRVILLDAGNSCDSSVPLCEITGGRASIIVLDAIGYDAVNITGFLSEDSREKLKANYLRTFLVDADHPFEKDGVAYSAKPPKSKEHHLHIALETVQETHLMPESCHGYIFTLQLRSIGAGQIGVVKLSVDSNDVNLMQANIHNLRSDVLPDATISGTLEFVEDEARYFAKNQKKDAAD